MQRNAYCNQNSNPLPSLDPPGHAFRRRSPPLRADLLQLYHLLNYLTPITLIFSSPDSIRSDFLNTKGMKYANQQIISGQSESPKSVNPQLSIVPPSQMDEDGFQLVISKPKPKFLQKNGDGLWANEFPTAKQTAMETEYSDWSALPNSSSDRKKPVSNSAIREQRRSLPQQSSAQKTRPLVLLPTAEAVEYPPNRRSSPQGVSRAWNAIVAGNQSRRRFYDSYLDGRSDVAGSERDG